MTPFNDNEDNSLISFALDLWGNYIETFAVSMHPIITKMKRLIEEDEK